MFIFLYFFLCGLKELCVPLFKARVVCIYIHSNTQSTRCGLPTSIMIHIFFLSVSLNKAMIRTFGVGYRTD